MRPPQPEGENAAAPAAVSTSASQQRGRKRAASCDAADPATRKSLGAGTAAGKAWTGGGGGGGGCATPEATTGEGGGVGTTPTAMDLESGSPASPLELEGGGGGGGDLSPRAAAAVEPSPMVGPVPVRMPGFSGGGGGEPAEPQVEEDGGLSSVEEIRSAGVIASSAVGGSMETAPPELPLLELEKQSTVDTLFDLMESGHSVSVLVWDLLMKMPTNMRLYNGFS